MRNEIKVMIMCLVAVMGASCAGSARAEGSGDDQDILAAVTQELEQKTLYSGTLDLYDPDLDAVRNLRALSSPERVQRRDDVTAVMVDYRDINSGDIVTVAVLIVPHEDGGYAVGDLKIAGIEPVQKNIQEEYSDSDIQDFMKGYIEQQTKFTGDMMLYDEEREVMRHLTLQQLNPEVRRMGILYISRGVFKDIETGAILGVDLTVKNTDGQLVMDAVRIRSFKKGTE